MLPSPPSRLLPSMGVLGHRVGEGGATLVYPSPQPCLALVQPPCPAWESLVAVWTLKGESRSRWGSAP